jgi:hypothetical protein
MTRLSATLREPAVMLEVYRIRAENGPEAAPSDQTRRPEWVRPEHPAGQPSTTPAAAGIGYQKKGGSGRDCAGFAERTRGRRRAGATRSCPASRRPTN